MRNRESAEYTSASLTTKGLHQWQYGRFEMRGRIDTRLGLWPAFWTLGVAGEWPACGEIDIMEHVNTNNEILGTIHWWYVTRDRRFIVPEVDPEFIAMVRRRVIVTPPMALIAIALSFVSTYASMVVYVILPASYLLPSRLDRSPTRRLRRRCARRSRG